MNHLDINEKFLFSLEDKLAELKQYLSITRQMSETITDSRDNQLAKLMSDRKTCIRKIQSIDKSIEQIRGKVKDKTNHFSYKSKGLFDKYAKRFKHIMDKIIPIDKQIYLLVKIEDDTIRNTLLTFRKNKHAVNRYRPQPTYSPKYLDTKK